MLARTGFNLGMTQNVTCKLFATENPNELFLEFSIVILCDDSREDGRTNALLRLNGDGLYSPTNHTFEGLRSLGEDLTWTNANGDPQETGNQYVYASGIVIGHKEVTYEVRHALPANNR